MKVVDVCNASPQELQEAHREINMLFMASQQLSGYTTELYGYCEQHHKLLLVMSLAHGSLERVRHSVHKGHLPPKEWVCYLALK